MTTLGRVALERTSSNSSRLRVADAVLRIDRAATGWRRASSPRAARPTDRPGPRMPGRSGCRPSSPRGSGWWAACCRRRTSCSRPRRSARRPAGSRARRWPPRAATYVPFGTDVVSHTNSWSVSPRRSVRHVVSSSRRYRTSYWQLVVVLVLGTSTRTPAAPSGRSAGRAAGPPAVTPIAAPPAESAAGDGLVSGHPSSKPAISASPVENGFWNTMPGG